MIIKSFEIKKNVKKDVNIYLFYGPNNGLIEDLINEDLKPIFSKNLYNYEEIEILSDIDNFKEFTYSNKDNKFELVEYQNSIQKNLIKIIIGEIILFLNS